MPTNFTKTEYIINYCIKYNILRYILETGTAP